MRDAGSFNDDDFRCWWCWWWNHKVTLRALQWLHGWIKVSPVLVFIKWKTCNCWRKLIIVRCFPSFLASGPSNEHVNLCTLGHWRSGWCQEDRGGVSNLWSIKSCYRCTIVISNTICRCLGAFWLLTFARWSLPYCNTGSHNIKTETHNCFLGIGLRWF